MYTTMEIVCTLPPTRTRKLFLPEWQQRMGRRVARDAIDDLAVSVSSRDVP